MVPASSKKSSRVYIALLFLISALFTLIMASSNSPAAPNYYGADSSFFSAVGSGMLRGRLPYVDYFDMKGPYLFFIEALGHWIAGTTGIFILEVFNLFAALLLIDGCARLLLGKDIGYIPRFLCQLPPLYFLCISFEGGNFTEEWSLVPLLLCLKLFIQYIQSGSDEHPPKYAFAYGCCFAFLALIRVTNAVLICAVVFTAFVSLLYRKQFLCLFKNAGAFILGFIVAALPAVLLCAYWGILREMLDCVFVFGFQYGVRGSGLRFKRLMLSLLFSFLGPLLFSKDTDRRYTLFMITSLFANLYCFTLGNLYNHYFTLLMPYIALSSIWLTGSFLHCGVQKWRRTAVLCVATLCLAANLFLAVQSVWNSIECILEIDNMDECNAASELGPFIPEEDRDSVFGWVRSYKFFEINQIDNWSKYCSWQENYIQIRPEIAIELEDGLSSSPPEWIVLSNGYLQKFDFLKNMLDSSYSLVASNEYYLLYNLRN